LFNKNYIGTKAAAADAVEGADSAAPTSLATVAKTKDSGNKLETVKTHAHKTLPHFFDKHTQMYSSV